MGIFTLCFNRTFMELKSRDISPDIVAIAF